MYRSPFAFGPDGGVNAGANRQIFARPENSPENVRMASCQPLCGHQLFVMIFSFFVLGISNPTPAPASSLDETPLPDPDIEPT